jgi:hypothetical protein
MRARVKQMGAVPVRSLAFALALTALSRPAHAQRSAEVSKADALFNAGRSLLEAGEYVDACPKFAEAQALAPGLGVTLYLADCYERLGRTASAMVEFKRAEQIALTRGDKRGAVAHGRAVSLEGHVPQLALLVTDAARAQGITVKRDGELVSETQWDVPLPIDPGEHEIVVSAPSKAERRSTVTLGPVKGTVTLNIERLEDRTAESPASGRSAADLLLPQSAQSPLTQKTAAFLVGGVGIFGLGVGSVLGALASSKLNQSNAGPCDASNHCSAQGLSLRDDADHFANASTGVFIGAGVAVAGGVALYFTAPKTRQSSEARQGFALFPLLSPQGLGLNVRGSF